MAEALLDDLRMDAGLEASARGRRFDDDEARRWNELTELIDELELRNRRLLDLANAPHATEEGASFDAPGTTRPRARIGGPHAADKSRALRAIEELPLEARAGDRLDDLIRRDTSGADARYLAAVSNPAYTSAFGKKLLNPEHARDEFTDDEVWAVRQVSEATAERAQSLTDTAGGFAVPATLDPTVLLTSDGRTNPLRQLARTVTIASDTWKGVSSVGGTASWDPEGTEVSDDTIVLAQPEVTPQKLAIFIPFSVEVGADWGSIQQELGGVMSDAKDELEAAAFIGGTGTVEPTGLLVGGTLEVTGGTAGTAIPSGLYSLQEALPPRYQPRATFLSSNAFMNRAFRSVPEASTDEAKFIPESRDAILGKSWQEVSHMATTAAGTVCAYGDIASAYVIADRVGMQVELIPHLFGGNQRPTGQRGLYGYARVGGGVVNENALRRLVTS